MVYDFEKTLLETTNIKKKYPDRIPIYIKKAHGCQFNDIDKHKFLVPNDLTLAYFITIIRKRIKIPPEKALFVFINNVLPPLNKLMMNIYQDMKDNDGFLYIYYNGESVFGI
jgi:GABA(A) receptor-associated protein|tara:strand:+ start:1107 stop:1442 length:336 start_codon:yes stop_codon:yes gene_type:complete